MAMSDLVNDEVISVAAAQGRRPSAQSAAKLASPAADLISMSHFSHVYRVDVLFNKKTFQNRH
jgi:hypothetical protein